MANITYHRFDENGQYVQTVSGSEETINFEDPSKIYVGDLINPSSGIADNSAVNLYYHDLNTNMPVLKPENPNRNQYRNFDYVTKEWIRSEITFSEPIILTAVEIAWLGVRNLRAKLLNSTDWTQLPDVPLTTKEAWATYRQALRDITIQTDPFNITWPTKPE